MAELAKMLYVTIPTDSTEAKNQSFFLTKSERERSYYEKPSKVYMVFINDVTIIISENQGSTTI